MARDALTWSEYANNCDVFNLILGSVLFAFPWVFGFTPGPAAYNALACGLAIQFISAATLEAFAIWEEFLNLIIGLWLVMAPWVLGFQDTKAMTTVSVVVGAVVALLATLELWMRLFRIRPRLAARL